MADGANTVLHITISRIAVVNILISIEHDNMFERNSNMRYTLHVDRY